MNKEIEKKLEALRKDAEGVLDNWIKVKSIEERVKSHLDDRLQQIICYLMGFTKNRWSNEWEVDTCNGRHRLSETGNFLRSQVKKGIDKWLEEKSNLDLDLPQSAIKNLQKTFKQAYKEALEEKLLELAEAKALEDAEKIIKFEL